MQSYSPRVQEEFEQLESAVVLIQAKYRARMASRRAAGPNGCLMWRFHAKSSTKSYWCIFIDENLTNTKHEHII